MTEQQLINCITEEIINQLNKIFAPIGGIQGIPDLMNDLQATPRIKAHSAKLIPLIMPELISGSNHR